MAPVSRGGGVDSHGRKGTSHIPNKEFVQLRARCVTKLEKYIVLHENVKAVIK
jgi:hypothetical protein